MSKYPAGYRFVPTDEELIDYLKMRINNDPIPVTEVIRDANVYGCDPKKLIADIFPEHGERQKSGYFFSPRDRKYPKGLRPNRKAGTGYWRANGADVRIKEGNRIIGHKKVLCFLMGEHPHGHKTRWIMHEYTLPGQPPRVKQNEQDMRLDDWVLCHVYERAPRRSDEDYEQVPVEQQDDIHVAEPHGAIVVAQGTTTETQYTTAMVPATLNGFGNQNNWFYDEPYYEPLFGEVTNDYSSYGSLLGYDYPYDINGSMRDAGNNFGALMPNVANEAAKRRRRP